MYLVTDFRELCSWDLEKKAEILEEGEPIMVEIDESYFFHQKYNRGKKIKGNGFIEQ